MAQKSTIETGQNAVKRHRVMTYLTARYDMSDRAIAEIAGVSNTTVSIYRRAMDQANRKPRARLGRDGKTYFKNK